MQASTKTPVASKKPVFFSEALDKNTLGKNTPSTETITDRWQRARDFVIDDPTAEEPFSQALKQEMEWDDQFTELAILEYKKFMVLSSAFPAGNMTPSVHVDTVWHMHLLYTHCYQRFCRDMLDCQFVHHEPSTGGEDQEVMHKNSYSQTLDKYVEVFGMEPPRRIWGARVRADLALNDESISDWQFQDTSWKM